LSFLNKNQAFTGSQSRSETFPGVGIAEGKWLLEASGNYMSNVNLKLASSGKQTLKVEVENSLIEDELFLSGEGLIVVFDQIFESIESFEDANEMTAKFLDVKVSSVVSTETIFDVTVKYGSELTPTSSNDEVEIYEVCEAANEFEFLANTRLAQYYDSDIWTADITILEDYGPLGLFPFDEEYPISIFTTILFGRCIGPFLTDVFVDGAIERTQDYIESLYDPENPEEDLAYDLAVLEIIYFCNELDADQPGEGDECLRSSWTSNVEWCEQLEPSNILIFNDCDQDGCSNDEECEAGTSGLCPSLNGAGYHVIQEMSYIKTHTFNY